MVPQWFRSGSAVVPQWSRSGPSLIAAAPRKTHKIANLCGGTAGTLNIFGTGMAQGVTVLRANANDSLMCVT